MSAQFQLSVETSVFIQKSHTLEINFMQISL